MFPSGLDAHRTPATSPVISRKSSLKSISLPTDEKKASRPSFFGRWVDLAVAKPKVTENIDAGEVGPIEELITAGTAFGVTSLFNICSWFACLICAFQGLACSI